MIGSSNEYLYDAWYAAAWDHEIVDGQPLARTFLDQPVVLYRGEAGCFAALADQCCHRGAPLALGRVEGDCLRCMYHGMKFGADGVCVEIPGQDRIGPNHRVQSYPVEAKNGLVWIWMGDPALADPGDILEFAPLSDARYCGLPQPGYMHYDANWLLIADNLADFSHLAFVHTNTLGGSEGYASSSELDVERLDDGFRFVRTHKGAGAPPYHVKIDPDADGPVDRRNAVRMHVPGVFFMATTFAPAGTDPDAPGANGVRQYRNCQFMTPETASTSHFFWDYLRDFRLDEPEVSVSLHESLLAGFMEDKLIIEAQQRHLDEHPGFEPGGIASDVPLAHFRKVLTERIAAAGA